MVREWKPWGIQSQGCAAILFVGILLLSIPALGIGLLLWWLNG